MARLSISDYQANISANLTDGGNNTASDMRTLLTDLADSNLFRVPVRYWQSGTAREDYPGDENVSTIYVLPRTGMYHVELPSYTFTTSQANRYIHFMTETSPGVTFFWNYLRYFELSTGSGGRFEDSNSRFDDRFDLGSNPQRAYYHSNSISNHNAIHVLFSTERMSIPE